MAKAQRKDAKENRFRLHFQAGNAGVKAHFF
jgi:hypothetical protein